MSEPLHTFLWDKKLETDIELVDSQHKEFLKRANTFIIKLLADKPEEGVREAFEFVNDYLQYHFQAEETFLADSGYPAFEEHQAEHQRMRFKSKEMEALIAEGDCQKITKEFTEFINNWVINHILSSDRRFAIYYRELKGLE
ncbi:hemerythrin family protein [Aminipila butyrica]|uniref:Hemerythrin family protein n=1 Tax=Aminipila butyrica TaxID=433296 RepID=A0A858BXF7_9FIRM|nr:hemerythrin family protein [Aminipila butyrica]QIB69580.1 hemerythrin family protein [Aminipila butyrica]